jgi:hypothetical protein
VSISLFSGTPSVVAVGGLTLLPANNYALTDINVIFRVSTGSAVGSLAALFCQLQSGGGAVFHTFAFAEVPTNATTGTFVFPTRSFPDSLILPRGQSIILDTTSFVNFTAVTLIVNISGTVTP